MQGAVRPTVFHAGGALAEQHGRRAASPRYPGLDSTPPGDSCSPDTCPTSLSTPAPAPAPHICPLSPCMSHTRHDDGVPSLWLHAAAAAHSTSASRPAASHALRDPTPGGTAWCESCRS
eukprot:359972-Chlamydomonas_euryale.AAC.7